MTGGGGGLHRGRVTGGPGTGAHWWGGRGPAGGGTHAARVGGRRGVLLIALLAALLLGGVAAAVALTRTSSTPSPAAASPAAPAPGTPTTSRAAGAPDVAVLQQTIDEVLVATPLRFPADSATPNAGATGAVDRLAAVLKASPGPTVTVEGHTAPTGEDTGDAQVLSQQRAEDVVRRLEAAGVPAGSLTAVGVGPRDPLGSLEASRRVELRVG